MKIEKLSIDGKKDSLEITDKIFSAKINKKTISERIKAIEEAKKTPDKKKK